MKFGTFGKAQLFSLIGCAALATALSVEAKEAQHAPVATASASLTASHHGTLESKLSKAIAKAFKQRAKPGVCRTAKVNIEPDQKIKNSMLSRIIRKHRGGARITVTRDGTTTKIKWVYLQELQRLCILHEGRGH